MLTPRTTTAAKLEGLPWALARLLARRASRTARRRAPATAATPFAALSSAAPRSTGLLVPQTPQTPPAALSIGVAAARLGSHAAGEGARSQPLCRPRSAAPRAAACAARADGSGAASPGADAQEAEFAALAEQFTRAANFERFGGYDNSKGKGTVKFGAHLSGLLEEAEALYIAAGRDVSDLRTARERARTYEDLRVPERARLLEDCGDLLDAPHEPPVPLSSDSAPAAATPEPKPASLGAAGKQVPSNFARNDAPAAARSVSPSPAAAVAPPAGAATPARKTAAVPPKPLQSLRPALQPQRVAPAVSRQPPASMQPLVLALAMATTGSDVSVHRVIELAVVDCATGAAFATLVTPGRMRVPSEVADATGITDAMVSGATVPGFALAAARLESAVEAWSAVRKGAPILLVGHNARRHAVRFLAAEYERSGGALPAGWRFVDTLPLAKALLPPTAAHDLAALHAHFRLGVCDARFPLGVCDARSAESAAHAVRDLLAPAVLGGLEADLTSLLLRESFSAIAAAPPPAGSGGARGVRPQAGAALQSLLEAADVQDDSVAERGDEDEGGGAGDDAEDGARRKSASRRAPKGAGAALLLPGRGLPSADPLSIVHALPGNVRLSDAARAQPTAWHETPLATCLPTADATLAGRAFSSLEALLQHVPTRFEERTGQAVLPIWPPLPGDQGGAMSEADWLRIVAAALRQAAELERSRGDWLQRVLGQRELARLRLVGGAAALQQMHAPASFADAVSARKRLAFEELFLQQVALLLRRNDALRSGTALRCPSTEAVDSVLAALLRQGKCLTAAERCALDDVLCDMADQQPMLRLLSGGAEIAYLALLAAHDAGVQGVLVAPTAAAAAQHHAQMQRLMDDAGVAPARRPPLQLLPAAEDALLRTGSTQRACVAFGTPVLLSENAAAAGAALLVVVGERCITAEQRSALCATAGEGRVPHVLTLSGAPLPRYLALAEFGDHAVSSIQLDALPAAATEPMPGSPLASLRVASLPEDAELLDEARRAAALVLRAVENRDELPPELLYALRARGLPVTEPRGAAGAVGDSGMSAAAA